jgi:SAM-dependent methyltransferase
VSIENFCVEVGTSEIERSKEPRGKPCGIKDMIFTTRNKAEASFGESGQKRMTRREFQSLTQSISTEAGVLDNHHAYFEEHAVRIYDWCLRFNLFDCDLGDVLDIGPFYAYTPFVLRSNSRSMTVIEANESSIQPLRVLYEKSEIDLHVMDLVDLFGPVRQASRQLPFKDASFDTILFWETLEHFSFNPVPFLRELKRIAKPGCRIITAVPNRASLFNVLSLFTGWNQERVMSGYFEHADDISDGKNVYHGLHWREYTLLEFRYLFGKSGFKILESGHILGFMHADKARGKKLLIRKLYQAVFRLFPTTGSDVYTISTV